MTRPNFSNLTCVTLCGNNVLMLLLIHVILRLFFRDTVCFKLLENFGRYSLYLFVKNIKILRKFGKICHFQNVIFSDFKTDGHTTQNS